MYEQTQTRYKHVTIVLVKQSFFKQQSSEPWAYSPVSWLFPERLPLKERESCVSEYTNIRYE
jgi:hypothetical protein